MEGAAMERMAYDAQRATVETPLGQVSYVDAGSGPAALFVHGLMLNNAVWRPLIGELHGARRCIAPDLVAHGRTQTAPDQDVSLSAQADMLEHLCQALELDQVDLVANDLGGAVAQLFAVRHPERLRTLTLTNCDTHYNLGPPADIRRIVPAAEAGLLGAAVARMLTEPELARVNFPGIGFEDPAHLTEELIGELIEPGFSTEEGQRHFERFILSIEGDELVRIEPQLRTLQAPTLLVWGADDTFFGLPWAYWLRDLLPGFRKLVELPRGRLFVQLERPREVAEAILEHWRAA
jgi:pimeloyl-ACP methyl ester carboxylesterase